MQYKGNEILNKRSENNKNNEYYELDIGLENLVSNKGILTGDINKQSNSTSIFRKDDVLFGRLRPYLNKWWHATEDGIKSGEIWALTSTSNSSSLFNYYFIQTNRFLYYANISSGTRMPRASWKNIESQLFNVPNINEQKLIGTLLKKVDNIITLEQEKVDKLELFSEQIFRMLYYKNWENSLQFNNSNQQWKATALKEILVEKNSRTTKNNEYPILSSTNNGLFLQSKYFKNQVASKDNIGYKILKKNQIVLSPQNLWLGNINYNDKIRIGIVSPSYKVFDIDNNYDKYLIGRLYNQPSHLK